MADYPVEQDAPTAPPPNQTPSVWDQVDALTPAKKKDVWDQVDAITETPSNPINFINDQAAKRDPATAARVIRVANRFKMPEQFVEKNLDALEEQEKRGEFNSQDLLDKNPKLAKLISESGPNAAALALKDLPNLKRLDYLYNRPMSLWPIPDDQLQKQARETAKLRAEKDWAHKDEPISQGGLSLGETDSTVTHGQIFSSQQQMEDAYYKYELESRREREKFVSGDGDIGMLEAAKRRFKDNPAFWMPFGGDVVDVAKMADLYSAKKAQDAGTSTPEQDQTLYDFARMEQAAQFRGTSFMGKLTESLMTLPAFAGELASTGGIYNAVEGAIFKGGKKGAELFLRGAFKQSLEKGFLRSVGEKAIAGTAGALAQAVPARGLASVSSEMRAQLDSGELKDMNSTVKNILVRSAADVLSAKTVEGLAPISKKVFNLIIQNDKGATLTMVQDQLRKGGISGFAGMVLQGETQKAVNALGGVQPYQRPTLEDIGIAAATGAIPHAGAAVIDLALGRSQSYVAKMYAQAAIERAQLYKDLSMAKEAPDATKALTENLGDGGAHGETYVPIAILKEHFGDAARDKAIELTGDARQYDTYEKTGGNLRVPTATYDRVIGQDEAASKKLSKEIRSAPDMMNLREADEWMARVEKAKGVDLTDIARQHIIDQLVEQAKGDKAKEATYLARAEHGGETLLQDPAYLGLNDNQVSEISKLIAKAQDASEKALTDKERARRDKLKGDLYAKEEARVKEQVTREVDQRREQRAIQDIQFGTINGEEHPEAGAPLKLSREDLKRDFPGLNLSDLPKGMLDGPKSNGIGVHPEVLAERHGYASAQEFLYAIAGEHRDKVIDAEVKRVMADRYPKILESAQLPEEAVKAIHNEYSGEIKRKTLEYIAQNKLSALETLNKVAVRKPPSMAAVREGAEKDVRVTPIGELDPRSYLVDERMAAREAIQALHKGDFEALFDAKLKELEAHERYRASQKALDAWKETLSDWRDVPSEKAFKKPETVDFGQQVKDLLRRIGVLAVDPHELEGMKPLDTWITEKEENGDSRLEPIYVDPRFRAEGFTAHYKDLTVDDIASLRDTIDQITYLAKDHGEVVRAADRISLESIKERLIAAIKEQYEKLPLTGFTKNEQGTSDKVKHYARLLDAAVNRPEAFFSILDGEKIDGPWQQELFKGSSDAQNDANNMRAQFVNAIIAAKKAMPKEIQRRLYDKVVIQGLERPLTRRTILGIALNGGSESNYSKMERGELKREGGLTHEQMQEAVRQLTEPEKDYVQATLDAIQQFFPRVDELNKWATGVGVKRVEAKQMFDAMGNRRGGYYPMMYDRLYSKTGEIQVSDSLGGLIQPTYRKATTNDGYRKSRVEAFSAPVDFDVDRLGAHMESTIQDLAYRKWLMGVNKIVSDAGVRKALADHLGPEYRDVPRNWVKRVVNDYNTPNDQSVGSLRKFMGALRSNATIVALAGRASTFLVHALSVGGPIAEIGPAHLMSGYKAFLKAPRAMWKMVTEASGEMAHFAETSNTHVYQNIQELGTRTDFKAGVQRLMYATIGFANMLRAVPTWIGAKEKAIQELKNAGHSEMELDRLANNYADKAVRSSIGAGSAKDIPAIMSKDAEFMRLMTMFYTPGSILYGQLRRIGHEAGHTGDYSKALFKTIMATVVAGTIHQLVKGKLPDEAKDEGWGEWWLKNQAEYPASALPLGHQFASGVVDVISGEHPKDFSFTPLGAAIDDNLKALSAGLDASKGEKDWDEFFKKAFKASGYWMGAPTGQLSVTGDYLYDMMNGTADPNDLGEFAHDLMFSRPKERR